MTRSTSALALLVLLASACGGDDSAADAAPIDSAPPGGTFSLSWSLEDPDGAALDCADVAGASVRVAGIPIDGVAGFSEVFSCATGMGTSTAYTAGAYKLEVDLRTASGASLLAAPVVIDDVVIPSGGSVDAGAAAFSVTTSGTATFTLAAQGDGDNCGAFPANGGIVDFVFEVADGDGTCLNGIDLVVGAGGGLAGTYTTDCTAPPTFGGCIEDDQTITVATGSGPYRLTITGQKAGPLDCYSRVSSFTIPGNDLTVAVGALPLALSAAAECNP